MHSSITFNLFKFIYLLYYILFYINVDYVAIYKFNFRSKSVRGRPLHMRIFIHINQVQTENGLQWVNEKAKIKSVSLTFFFIFLFELD